MFRALITRLGILLLFALIGALGEFALSSPNSQFLELNKEGVFDNSCKYCNIYGEKLVTQISGVQDFTSWVDKIEIESRCNRLENELPDHAEQLDSLILYPAYNSEAVLSSKTKTLIESHQQACCDNLIGRPLWLLFRNCEDI